MIDSQLRFDRDGCLTGLPAIGASHAAAALSFLESVSSLVADGKIPARAVKNKGYTILRSLYDLAINEAVLQFVETLIGPDLVVISCQVWPKSPNDGRFVGWHQDSLFANLSENKGVTCWIALTDSTQENGCIQAIPGSHLQPTLRHYRDTDMRNIASHYVELATESFVALEVSSGDMSAHHINTIHGSPAARGGARRIGVSITYTPAYVYRLDDRKSALLVRGVDRNENWLQDPVPRTEVDLLNVEHNLRCADQEVVAISKLPIVPTP